MTDIVATPSRATAFPRGLGLVISKVSWALALILMGALFYFGEYDLSMASSAPQQAAAAAMACFRLVAVYALARGVDALCR
jgi:hypothetical protein